MAFNRNIPQEQEMLSQLPDEMLESGLNATSAKSPFTQYLGALEMTKRVQQRKSAKTALDGQNGQKGTVVGRLLAQQVPPVQNAPSFMTGGEVPPQFQPGYVKQGGLGGGSPAPGRDSMTMQHRTSPNTGGKVDQTQLAYNRSPQKLAAGGIVQAAMSAPTNIAQGKSPEEILREQVAAATGATQQLAQGGEVQSYATGGVTPIERRRLEEERRKAYLASIGMPTGPQEVVPVDAPLEGPQMSFDPSQTTFDAEDHALASASLGAPAGNRSQMIAEDQMQGYRNPLQRLGDATGLFTGTAGYQPEAIEPRPESDWGAAGPPPMSIGAPAQLPVKHAAPGAERQEYGAIPDETLADMHAQMVADKAALDLDSATAADIGETDEQRSARFTRANALATMAESFGSEATFFKGLTKGVAGAADVMASGDQTARDRTAAQSMMDTKQQSAGQMLALKAQGLRNDLMQGVAGTDIKIKTLAADEVRKDIELGVSQMPDDEAGMARLLQSKIVSMGFGAPQQQQSPGAAVLGTRR